MAPADIFIGHLKCGPRRVNNGYSEVKSRHNYRFQSQAGRDVAIQRPLSDRAGERVRQRESGWMGAQ
ncbi:Hypothetical predicted protein [Xyrichtys novacula]|uniref:Uncharacterized protein n=1 Tax=Xyrichtys novacula TaxID=13765 RepID=A0AAV1HM34_XYRNO|nr:Hypothetical predicted protein [Xyrichtys novacula]